MARVTGGGVGTPIGITQESEGLAGVGTWGERLTHIRNVLEEPVPDVWRNETLQQFANEALVDIQGKLDIEEEEYIFHTQEDVREYSRPERDEEPVAMFRNDRGLVREFRYQWKKLTPHTINRVGAPTHYMITNTSIVLRPIPDDQYEIKYYSKMRAPVIEEVDSLVQIDPNLYRAFDAYVLARAYEQSQEWIARNVHWDNYLRFMAEHEMQKNDEMKADTHFESEDAW